MKPQFHRRSVTQKRAVLAAAGAADGNMSRTEWSDEESRDRTGDVGATDRG